MFLGRRKRDTAELENGDEMWTQWDPLGNDTDSYSIVKQVDADILEEEDDV